MKLSKQEWVIAIGMVLVIILAVFALKSGNFSVLGSSDVTKIAMPHFASLKCQPTQDKVGLEYNVPKGGALINQNTVGFYTNSITNIKMSFTTSYWSTDLGTKVKYSVCDVNGNNCGAEQTKSDYFGGKTVFPINSIDLTKNSLRVKYQRVTLLGAKDSEGLKISYDSKSFGLALFSTTIDPAGKVVCSTSCDLSCPSQAVRDKLVFTTENSIDFYGTAPYLEYWDDIDYNLNAQFGGSVYDEDSKTFCLAGSIYTSKSLTLENGFTYIYPDTATRVQKECCKGAVISTAFEDKFCQSDYTWKTVSKDTKIRCTSDLSCPGAGQYTCQEKNKNKWSCSGSDSLGRYCVEGTDKTVACCLNTDCASDMICENYKCVAGAVTPPIVPNPNSSNSAGVCPDRVGGLVPGTLASTSACGFLGLRCAFGVSPKITTECVYNYTIIWIIAIMIFAIILTLILVKKYRK